MFDLEDGNYAIIAGDNPCAGQLPVQPDQLDILRIESASED